MTTKFCPGSRLILLALLLLALSGCGSKTKLVKGQIVRNGQPFTLSEKGLFVMAFYTEDDKVGAQPFPAESKPDGTFVVVGRDRKGITPGRYRVAVEAMDPYSEQIDLLQGKFAPATTNLVVDVTGADLTIDVDKETKPPGESSTRVQLASPP